MRRRSYRFYDEDEEKRLRKEKYLELKEREIAAREERNRLRKQTIAAEKARERAITLRHLIDKFSVTNAVSLISKITMATAGVVALLRLLAEFNPESARIYMSLTTRLSRAIEAIVNGGVGAVSKASNIIDMIISKLKREGR